MKQNMLRPPRTVGEWLADALRILALLGVVVAAVWFTPTATGVAALALPGVVAPRLLGLRTWFDIAFCVAVIVAAWSNVFDLYTTVLGWDLLVHFGLTGLLAALAYVLLERADIVASPRTRPARPIVLATAIGLALSAVWEGLEWFGWRFISDGIFVAYEDTIGDMAMGGLGALFAGILLSRVPLVRGDAA